MNCVNGCAIPESELDDAIELQGKKLLCGRCFDALLPDSKREQRGGQKGRECFNPAFTRGAYDPR